ncbi:hypothetical protein ACXR0O_01475 [Verrucomicrobiota bacterium sgz303538]
MNRLFALLITGFWITMWTLLLRTELEPQRAALREVPIEHVLKLFFQHQQPSDLFLHGEGGRLGHVRLHPQIRKEDGMRVIDFSGNAQLRIPGAPRHRVAWEGEAELTPSLELARFQLSTAFREATTQQAPETTVRFSFESMTKSGSYELRSDQQIVDAQTFTLDEPGIRKLLDRIGVDPALLQTVNLQVKGTPPHLTAHQSSLRLKGDKIDTLLVTAELNGQTLFEFHVSQLGQVIQAKTITGWTLETD